MIGFMILSVALSFARDRSLGNARRLLKSSILYLPLLLLLHHCGRWREAVHGLMIKPRFIIPLWMLWVAMLLAAPGLSVAGNG